jgi:hypothetical protein
MLKLWQILEMFDPRKGLLDAELMMAANIKFGIKLHCESVESAALQAAKAEVDKGEKLATTSHFIKAVVENKLPDKVDRIIVGHDGGDHTMCIRLLNDGKYFLLDSLADEAEEVSDLLDFFTKLGHCNVMYCASPEDWAKICRVLSTLF